MSIGVTLFFHKNLIIYISVHTPGELFCPDTLGGREVTEVSSSFLYKNPNYQKHQFAYMDSLYFTTLTATVTH